MAPSLAPIHDHSDKRSRWGAAIGAAFIVNLCTLIGIVVFATKLLPCMKENQTFIKASLLSFSGGTMLSIAVFLMLLDASRLISSGHVDEDPVQVTWRWGTMLLAGFSLSWLIHVAVSPFCGHHHPGEADSAASKGSAATDAADIVDASSYEVRVTGDSANTIHVARDAAEKTRIMCSIVIGDGVHNLFDGFIIGAAFTFCDSSFGWAIVGSTIVHEIAQEIGDFVTLTMRAGLKPLHALLVNFIAGLPVFMGVIIALAGDPSAEVRTPISRISHPFASIQRFVMILVLDIA